MGFHTACALSRPFQNSSLPVFRHPTHTKTVRGQSQSDCSGLCEKTHCKCAREPDGEKISAAGCLDHALKIILQSGPQWENLRFLLNIDRRSLT
jgi:hypothetical protein